MPTFTVSGGGEAYVPFHGMVMLEALPGGLETRIWLMATMDSKPVGLNVKGTLDTVRQAFIEERLRLELGISNLRSDDAAPIPQ